MSSKPFDKVAIRSEICGMGSDAPCGGILVVDDDPDIRDSLREVLEDEGYEVACVGNGREALDYLKPRSRDRA